MHTLVKLESNLHMLVKGWKESDIGNVIRTAVLFTGPAHHSVARSRWWVGNKAITRAHNDIYVHKWVLFLTIHLACIFFVKNLR